MQDLVDIAAVSRLAHAAGATVIVDNVFATPVLSRPLELRRRRRRVLRDQAHRRAGARARRRDPRHRRVHPRPGADPHPQHRPVAVGVQRVGAAQGPGDAVAARAAPDRVGPAGRDVARAAARRLAGPLPVPAVAPAARARARAAVRAAGPSSRSTSPCPRARRPTSTKKVTFGVPRRAADRRHLQQPRRRQVARHAPGDDDAPQARSRGARGGRHRRVDRAAVRRARGPRRPDRRPRAGPGHARAARAAPSRSRRRRSARR